MIEVLEFIFSGFWTFVGCAILLWICVVGLALMVRVFK